MHPPDSICDCGVVGAGAVAAIIVRTLRKDIDTYNESDDEVCSYIDWLLLL